MRAAGIIGATALLACATTSKPAAVSFAEAGLTAIPRRAPARGRPETRLERATGALLTAIERASGERPAFDDGTAALLLEQAPAVSRRQASTWNLERTALATELMRALDTGEATVNRVRRARAALRWDLMLGARWTAVDRRLVEEALTRADAVLPRTEPTVEPARLVFEWPIDPVRITSRFGVRVDPFGEGARRHGGVDLAALEGQMVKAAAAGTVVFAGMRPGYGLHVELRHDTELVTRYAHLSELEVSRGQAIAAGEVLGRAGRTGRATGPHLHFELWREGLPVDPEEELPGALARMVSVVDEARSPRSGR